MRVLIYGANGWIGMQVCEILTNMNIPFKKANSRVDNVIDVENEIIQFLPSHVMSFIGRTHGSIDGREYKTIDYLEQPGKLRENVRDNLFSPIVLALICQKYKMHFTYLGTGCIFEYPAESFGEEINGFKESDIPNFFGSSYSIVKGYTDMLMHMFPDALNLRIRMPITADRNPRNFITKITTYQKICSIPNSMTVLPELLPIAIDMMKRYVTGTINLTNPGLISHNEILEMYKEIVDPSFEWETFTLDEQAAILAAGRSNNYLDTSKLQELYPNVKGIKESVRDCLIEMAT